MVEYRIVWVAPENPEYVEDIYADEILELSNAESHLKDAKEIAAEYHDAGIDAWVPRIQSVTYSFIE